MLNLWIALTKGVKGLPLAIHNLGYRHKGIEWHFANSKRERIQPELIVCSDSEAHSCLLEWKSGKNVETAQLQRYAAVTQSDLKNCGCVSPEAAKSHDVVIVGQRENARTLKQGLLAAKVSFPLVLSDASGLKLDANTFGNASLQQVFVKGLPIDWGTVTTSFVPLDAESPRWRVAERVVPKVIGYMAREQSMIDVVTICRDVCNLWDSMGPAARQALTKRVQEVLADAAAVEFKPHLSLSNNGTKLTILHNPFDGPAEKKTGTLRRFKTAQKELIARLKKDVLPGGGEQTRMDI